MYLRYITYISYFEFEHGFRTRLRAFFRALNLLFMRLRGVTKPLSDKSSM